MEYVSKRDGLLKKHGVKMLGNWIVLGEHLNVFVLDAPSSEDLEKFFMEPEFMAINAFDNIEVKMALNAEEVIKMLRQAK